MARPRLEAEDVATRVIFRVGPALYAEAERTARASGMTISQLCRAALESYLSQEGD